MINTYAEHDFVFSYFIAAFIGSYLSINYSVIFLLIIYSIDIFFLANVCNHLKVTLIGVL